MSSFWDLCHCWKSSLCHTVVNSWSGGPLIATVAWSWPWGSQLDHTGTCGPLYAYEASSLSAGCLFSGLMALPDPPFLKVLHFLCDWFWVLANNRDLHKLSNMWFFFELTDLATHVPKDPLLMCFSISFSLAPALFFLSLLSARLPWWLLPLPSPVQWAAHPRFLSNHNVVQCCLKRWCWYHQRKVSTAKFWHLNEFKISSFSAADSVKVVTEAIIDRFWQVQHLSNY